MPISLSRAESGKGGKEEEGGGGRRETHISLPSFMLGDTNSCSSGLQLDVLLTLSRSESGKGRGVGREG